jgi:uncharacterized protein YidB (DUF937 family)
MTALLGLLAIAGYQNRDKIAEMLRGGSDGADGTPGQGSGQATQQQGGLAGSLGGALGGLLGGAGGAGAGNVLNSGLGELLERFQQAGHGDKADSWVRTGPNQEIAPNHLEEAIGPDVLDTLAQRTGLSRDELLARLSRELPGAIDQYTPDGRLPA